MIKEKILTILKTFFSEKFIKFCIIGILNTIIHLIVYNLLRIEFGGTISNTIAFIIASIFSYFANSLFTYKTEIRKKTFLLAMLIFTIKLLLSDGLEYLFSYLFTKFNVVSLIKYNPIFITAIILPLQFLIFNRIFRESKYETDNKKIVSSKIR